MKREIIPITSEEQWLALRKQDITSTSMAALLDLSDYATPFEVYHAHKSGVQVPFDVSERMEKGKRMEAYVANEIALERGWKIRPLNVYVRIPELKMGASFDFEYIKPDGKKGIMEIKGVDYFQHKEKWEKPEDDGEATAYVEVQLQHQLEVFNEYDEGCIVAATGIYDFHVYERPRNRDFGQDLVSVVKRFWADVEAGNEPKPNFYRDGAVISELYKDLKPEAADFTKDDKFNALCAKFERLRVEEANAGEEREATKWEIHAMLGENGKAFAKDFEINATRTKDSTGTLVTEAMVGTVIGARRGYRQCKIKALNK